MLFRSHQLPFAVIHRIQDTEPNMGIIRTILPRPHHRMGIPLISGRRILGIPHSPCQLDNLRRRRQPLLLPSINTEEMVKFLVDKEKEERSPKVQLNDVLVLCFKFWLIKVCRFHSSLILCLLSGFHNLVFLL